jgi:hypothetical protein
VDVEESIGVGDNHPIGLADDERLGVPAPFGATFAAGVVDEDALHGNSGGPEEHATIGERGFAEAQIGFVDQGCGVERVPGRLLRQLGRG